MKAIETKYVGPSNVRGSRYIASDLVDHAKEETMQVVMILSTGANIATRPTPNGATEAFIANAECPDREMTDAEWSKYCETLLIQHKYTQAREREQRHLSNVCGFALRLEKQHGI